MPEINRPRRERLGINLFDLSRLPELIRDLLLRDRSGASRLNLRREDVVRIDDDRLDETCVPFVCNLLDAAAVCDAIREHDRRAGEHRTRVYLKRRDAWERLTREDKLTLVVGGKLILNPAVFPAEGVEIKRPEAQAVVLGG